jgi:hypothetical protein
MMKKYCPPFYLYTATAASVKIRLQTSLKIRKVQFAIVTNDTFHFSNPNLSFFFRDGFNKGKIKVSIIPEGENISKINYSPKKRS